jgi:hypothetical protein
LNNSEYNQLNVNTFKIVKQTINLSGKCSSHLKKLLTRNDTLDLLANIANQLNWTLQANEIKLKTNLNFEDMELYQMKGGTQNFVD